MEATQTASQDIKTGALQRINIILTYLSDININDPENFNKRYDLFRALFNDMAQFMKPDEQHDAEAVMEILLEELNRFRKKQPSQFMITADKFEREMRSYAHNKIKIGGF